MAQSEEERVSSETRRMQALGRANEIRQRRAETKRALRARELDIADPLSARPYFLLTARLADMLLSVPGYGEVRVGRLLRDCKISSLNPGGENHGSDQNWVPAWYPQALGRRN